MDEILKAVMNETIFCTYSGQPKVISVNYEKRQAPLSDISIDGTKEMKILKRISRDGRKGTDFLVSLEFDGIIKDRQIKYTLMSNVIVQGEIGNHLSREDDTLPTESPAISYQPPQQMPVAIPMPVALTMPMQQCDLENNDE